MRLSQRHHVVEIERKRSLHLRGPDAGLGHSRESRAPDYRSGVARAGTSSAVSLLTLKRVPL
jgi:hypothetical protein